MQQKWLFHDTIHKTYHIVRFNNVYIVQLLFAKNQYFSQVLRSDLCYNGQAENAIIANTVAKQRISVPTVLPLAIIGYCIGKQRPLRHQRSASPFK